MCGVFVAATVLNLLAPAQQLVPHGLLPMGANRQTAPNAQKPDGYTLQVNSQEVVLDVVVTDKKGLNVKNLTPNDFTLYEDGVPQTIRSFEEVSPESAVKPLRIDSTAELDKAEPDAPVSIIVLDEVTTKFEDLAFARYSLKKYLKSEGSTLEQPTMLVAVNYENVATLHDYTTSRKEILDALEHHLENYVEVLRTRSSGWAPEQVDATFGSLIAVAEATAGHPGHKNMIWIGRGFPTINMTTIPADAVHQLEQQLADCTTLLRNSRVTLYTVDPAGLSGRPAATDASGFYIVDDPFDGSVSFDTIARATGGRSLHGTNDVDHLIDQSVKDGQSFYTISYVPPRASEDAKPFRSIQVLMKDRKLTATTREGYYVAAVPVVPVLEADGTFSKQFVFDLSVAVRNLLVYDGVPLGITRDPAAPDGFVLHMPAAVLGMQRDAAQKLSAELTVVAVSFDKKGEIVGRYANIVKVQLTAADPQELQRQMVDVTLPVKISTQTPAARVRFVVRSDINGKIGAGNVYLGQ